MRLASTLGCAHVGLHVIEDMFIPACGSVLADDWFTAGCAAALEVSRGAIPSKPCSLPALTRNVRETFIRSASISTRRSSIMQAEYWCEPSRVTRDPWGITHVGIRAISSIALVSTTETLLGTGSP